jgi:membrane-associated phospholipid phosphatase
VGLDEIWNRAGDCGRVLLIGAALAAPLVKRDVRGSFNALTGILATSAACKAIKAFWREPRPNGEDRNSFPSQHAAECFAAAVSLDRQFKDAIGPAAIGLATAVSLTRVFGRKHHPPDVIAGAALGVLAGRMTHKMRG